MSTPSTPAQGDLDPNAAGPTEGTAADSPTPKAPSTAGTATTSATPEMPCTMGTAATGAENSGPQAEAPVDSVDSAISQPDVPPYDQPDVPPYEASQENMAHEYVDYYVTNPVDMPKAPPTSDDSVSEGDATVGASSSGAASTSSSPVSAAAAHATGDGASGPPLPPTDGKGASTAPPIPPVPPAPPGDDAIVPSPTASPTAVTTAGAPAPPEAKAMTLMDHLGELRTRLVRSGIVVALAFAATYSIADLIFAELMRPLLAALPPNSKLIFTALPEAFFVYLQVGFVAAIFLASPYIFYQIWGFIAPGLYEEEKKFAVPMALCSAFFFTLGAAFCFLVVFPFSFTFFVGFATDDIIPMPSLSEYLSFALKMLIAFGLIFEMPLFTFFLARMGLVTAAMMRKVRRYAILVIFIVAAILTPPDVMSQLLMAIPMLLLYELSIYIAMAFGRKPKADREADDSKNTAGKAAPSASGEPTAPTAPTDVAASAASGTSADAAPPAPTAPQG